MKNKILAGYAKAANDDFIERIEAISSAELLSPISKHIPSEPCHILDIGAGTGRDAAWLASLSHTVVAVEPVDALRHAGMTKHNIPGLFWTKDSLPHLSHLLSLNQKFDFVLLCAVWQHLDNPDRKVAMSALRLLIKRGGKLIVSLRHGPGASTRPVFPTSVDGTVKLAEANGLCKAAEISTQSVQAGNRNSNVTWTWLVLRA